MNPKHTPLNIPMILIALATPGLFVGCGSNAGTPGTPGDLGDLSDSTTPGDHDVSTPMPEVGVADDGQKAASLADDLRFLREEEKLARDVYTTLYAKWKVNVFNNISKSEQQHTDAVKALIAARGFVDPVTDDTVGVFQNPTLAGLYKTLTAKGSVSMLEALVVGATIEDLDIHDIEQMKARTSDAEVLALYDRLQCGSRNHLRAFVGKLGASGGTYTPQYISTATYNSIIQGSAESCG
jgi:hypothetical protein